MVLVPVGYSASCTARGVYWPVRLPVVPPNLSSRA